MTSLVLMMALSQGPALSVGCPPPGNCSPVPWGCAGGMIIVPAPCGGLLPPLGIGGVPPSTVVGEAEKPVPPPIEKKPVRLATKWPAPVTAKVLAQLEKKELPPSDAERFIDDAQAFGCKGAEFSDLINVPGIRALRGNELKDALQIYMTTLHKIATNPTAQKWPGAVTAKVKTQLENKGLNQAEAERFIEDAQAFGCKGSDFTDFINVPGIRAQKGSDLKQALQIYMKNLKTVQQQHTALPAPARILVQLPADATLTIDGVPTTSRSASRAFVTPALEPGQVFTYRLEASLNRDGRRLVTAQTIRLQAGHTTHVVLEIPSDSGLLSQR